MNYAIYLMLLNLILISRLRLLFKDKGATTRDGLIMGVIPCLALPFLQFNLSWFILLAYLVIYPWLFLRLERKPQKLSRNRLLMLLFHILGLGFFASPLFLVEWNAFPGYLNSFVRRTLLLEQDIFHMGWMHVQILLFGMLLVINEMNIILRYVLNLLQLKPLGKRNQNTDNSEYNTGRIIGILERIFVFIFVLLSQYTAIGFILAAKGVARFPDFKSRTFAEYVLIGTLLSTLLAMIVGYLVKGVIEI